MQFQHPELSCVVTRSQVHAVTDDTNKTYLKAVFRVLDLMDRGIRRGRFPAPTCMRELDSILAAIVDDLIYLHEEAVGMGRQLHAAWAHVFPECSDSLPSFSRSVLGWNRLAPAGEQQALCLERWGAILRSLFEHAYTRADEGSAIWYATQKETYAREQDMEQLKNTPQDVAVHFLPKGGVQIALFFGLSSRGESVKTSQQMPNQGVIVEELWVANLLHQHLERVQPGDRIFKVSREQVTERVAAAVERLKLDPQDRRLHRLRHTGPANDILTETRTLEQVRRRGRWLSLRSVERYTKTAHLVSDLARLPQDIIAYGREFLANPAKFATLLRSQRASVFFSQ